MSRKQLDCNDVIRRVIEHFNRRPEEPLDEETRAHLRECHACHGRAELEQRARAQPGGLSCEEVMELLFVYLDQEVDGNLNERIEQHLHSCRDCYSRAEFERQLRARVQDSGEVRAPERLQKRIRGILDKY